MSLLRVFPFLGLIFVVKGLDVLTENFFENLRGHPLINGGVKQFIDDQIHNYVTLATGKGAHSKKKRSLLETFTKNDEGVYLLSGVTPSATIPVRFPEDLLIFSHDSHWFAAGLESPNVKQSANYLVIFSHQGGSFVERTRIPVVNGVKIASIALENSTLLAVSENDAAKDNFRNKSGIYQFDGSTIVKVQSIDMHYATDVIFWKLHDEIYMSVAHNLTEIPIYKWLGRHFDEVQRVPVEGVRSIESFVADDANFLGFANFGNEGNTRVYSEIYKYDYHSEKYELHQRIFTRGCTDLEVFTLGKDTFLAVANSLDGDEEYETESIVYKLVDDYFVPFESISGNAIEQWLALEDSHQFVLFSISRFDGIKAFQYDGWSFQEVPQKFPNLLQSSGIKSLRPAHVENNSIVVASKINTGKIPNVFRLEFKKEEALSEIYAEMGKWCDQGLKRVEELSESVLVPVLGRTERGDIEDHKEEIEEIETKMDSLSGLLDRIVDRGAREEITAHEIVFENVTFIRNLNATKINDFQMEEFLDNVVDINKGFELEQVRFSTVEVEDSISVKHFNGEDVDNLIRNTDDLNLEFLSIPGTLNLLQGINIGGKLNGQTVDDNLLRRKGDQHFTRPLDIGIATVGKITAEALNGENLSSAPSIPKDIRVKNLTIAGYLNDVDLPTLNKYALKKTGSQTISSLFIFDSLEGDNLEVTGEISGQRLSDLIGTQTGIYTIKQDLIFDEFSVDDLRVLDSINGVKVDDILWRNHSREQEITGSKLFEDVVIHQAIFLQGHINSDYLDRMNPVVSIDQNIFLEGDKTITGGVEIENLVRVADVITSGGGYSLTRLESRGLKLTTKEIEPHLQFVQQLNADEIFADTINGKNVTSFVVTGLEEPQLVEGVKTFIGDLKIEGSTEALKINNVDVEDLENRILKVDGDQTVTGKHHVKHVVVESITSGEVVLDPNMTLITPTTDGNFTVFDNFKIDAIRAKTIQVKGSLNDLEFDEIVDDTVTTGANRMVGGHKYFKNLTVDDLEASSGVGIEEMPEEIKELRLGGPLTIANIKIDELYFDDECNGVRSDGFGNVVGNGTVEGDYEFDSITVHGEAFIGSNKINEFDINDIAYNSVKVDEPHHFASATFEDEVVSNSPISLDGQIENLDFDNIVLSDQFDSTIFDRKTFDDNLTVNGSVRFDSYINGFNLTKFCQFATGQAQGANVTIDGNVFFARGPNVGKINGVDTKRIDEQAWFEDRDTILSGSIDFEDVVFKDDVRVEGFVDNISLSLISENYFSKSKDQRISATFTFESDLIFENEVTVPRMNVNGGKINELNLEEFIRTALLDDYDQVFETVVFLENCLIENLTGEFTVNGLELGKDVMLHDKVNMVTGEKTFKNLNVEYLKLDKDIRIQDVFILDWLRNIVLGTTDYNITGIKTLRNAHFENGFQLAGTLNNLRFNTDEIMLKDLPQEITGTKTIHTKPSTPVFFKGIKLKGRLNGMDVSDLVNNQAYRNQDNVFRTSLNLYNNISTTNLVINNMYDGVNVTELMGKIENLGVLNNLVEQYEKLLVMTHKLRESIKGQAYFLHYYKIVQTINSVRNIRKILCPDGVTRLGILVSDGRMDLYGWQREERRFSYSKTIDFRGPLSYVDQVLMGRYLYTESEDTGNFLRMGSLESFGPFLTNTTIHTHSFTLPATRRPCTIFVYAKDPPRILCEDEDGINLKQTIPLNAAEASSVLIRDTLYLIIVSQAREGVEAFTSLWRCRDDGDFHHHQSLFEAHPESVSTVSYGGFHFLAIASGHLQNAMYPGRVEIRRFEETTERFVPWQSLELDAPLQVQFSVLQSRELILYVLIDNPTEPLLVFRYEGIAGFRLTIKGSALPQISRFVEFEDGGVVVAQSHGEINVIAASFKGEQVEE